MIFKDERSFEDALINLLTSQKGWDDVLNNPNEEDLINNWAEILFNNNKEQDRLNNVPLNRSEMNQILEQINSLASPLKKNEFINGKSVSIKRENEKDTLHFGKEVSLKIYDRQEIAAGQSYYQIARQPRFTKKSPLLSERRGDFMLLINGMPVIHVELKRSSTPISKPIHQIKQYMYEQVFIGIFSLIQVFVAMTPDETVYFANPGEAELFNKDYFFRWADFNNEPVNDWKQIADTILSIPMAHQIIGFYTIPDSSDNTLKVMRSYQIYAAREIANRVVKIDWHEKDQLGGYIWHTTGSGKTLTSFKSAQLIASSGETDKVVFLMDRIELGSQSLAEFKGFAELEDEIHGTDSTLDLISKLKSDNPTETLIVTSIQKMSNIKSDGIKYAELRAIQSKRIVIIIDEAHRSTFGEMLARIKFETFPDAIYFGFTGTPIHEENMRKDSTTATIFGDELHRYSLVDGIRDKNVLGFDATKVATFKDITIRREVALMKAKANNEVDAVNDPVKSKIYYKYMDEKQVPIVGYYNENGIYISGIEDYIPMSQYRRVEHQQEVTRDILENWIRLSRNGKFHALLATSSIIEAIEYYRILKDNPLGVKVTALFDKNFDYTGDTIFKQDGLVEIIEDYNTMYGQDFSIPKQAQFKKDITLRLAHKYPYHNIDRDNQIDIVIVVDQLLTGYDSKYINTLYLDKVTEYANIIQAFSRTNRLMGSEKPFGIIRYYRKVHTMEKNIKKAVKLYSGDKEIGLFVEKLGSNLLAMNRIYEDIKSVFESNGIHNFEKLPDSDVAKQKFADLFKEFNTLLEAALIQGFNWEKNEYFCEVKPGEPKVKISILSDKQVYQAWLLRYKELGGGEGGGTGVDNIPFDIDYEIVEKDSERIDYDYLNANFRKYIRLRKDKSDPEELDRVINDLHRFFLTLTKEQQKYADMVLYDLQNGALIVEDDKEFMDYINEYQSKIEYNQIQNIVNSFGLDNSLLNNMLNLRLTDKTINEFGRFDKLMDSVDIKTTRKWFEEQLGHKMKLREVYSKIDQLLRDFIIGGGFDIEEYIRIDIDKN
ncbi:HsdR family type I site-specific deoxyribonuclease [Iocasia frigidifontis]|uniref:Type I restriction enzyme endonuclease subunit n=1 Tax=Iocasia fonsfrigidae TaxID=2682810 RepID=A0A8A7KBK7_9FIRM|nr:HsdR family type I site-specific deoxyribonuclease [Iocasia fonsfrigidae]QTL97475.1 HsdR family type I site-specific deoxyribonuclease [Iocasia fonsfrigidae]